MCIPLGQDHFHRCPAHVFDGSESEPDTLIGRDKLPVALIDVGRQYCHPFGLALGNMFCDLLGLAQIKGEIRRHECLEMMRLEKCRLIGHQGICRGMGFVEPVIGKLFHEVEDLDSGLLGDAILHCPVHEDLPVCGHLGCDLLAHGPPQEIRLAQGVSGEFLCDLHDLFLVDDNPVGLAQDALEQGMRILDLFPAVLPLHVRGDKIHGAGPIQRNGCDDVLEFLWTELSEHLLHPAAFQLEHTRCITLADELVGAFIIQGNLCYIEVAPP